MSSKRKGIWIPMELIEDHKLDWINKVLLSEIISLNELEDGCIASNNHFARLLGLMNPSSASKRITKLKEMGYINTNFYYKDGLCAGRRITLSHSHENNTLIPVRKRGSSKKSRGVVPQSNQDDSVGNTINTVNNSSLLNQVKEQNIGAGGNNGMSLYQFMKIKGQI